MNKRIRTARHLARSQTGVSSIEYALLASLVAMACLGAVGMLGTDLDLLYVKICSAFPGANC